MPVYVIDTVYPKNNGDFAVTDDLHMRGGFHACVSHIERDAITAQRRKIGMFVWTQSDGKLWRLDVGDVWVEIITGGSSGASKIETPYTWSDYATGSIVVGVVPIGRTVQSVMLFVDVAFDGGVGFTVGDAGGTARFFTLADNSPTQTELYVTDSGHTYGSNTEVRLYMVGGVPPTVGSGRVIVFFS
jgi:hypothetical protein